MAVYDYAEAFTDLLQQKYTKEMCSVALTQSNPQVKFLNAQTIKLPRMTVSGYKDHTRTPGFNSGTLSNDWEPKKLSHDRDIEFFVDPLDIEETNLTLSMANIQNTFETEQAIPEKDSYRFSKLHSELTKYSGRIDSTVVDQGKDRDRLLKSGKRVHLPGNRYRCGIIFNRRRAGSAAQVRPVR